MARTRRSLVFTGPETIQIRTGDVPDPDPDTVLVRASLSAISPGTERLIYRGLAPAELPADPTFDSLSGSLSYPLQYGYAAVGDVVETGADVSEAWLGERVLAFHPHESHFLADPGTLVPIPDTISEARAALLPSIETAVSLVHDGAPRLGETVVVFGQGLVGLLVTSILSAFPLSNLVAVEPIERRRHRSRSFGADESVHPDALDTAVSMPTDGDDEPTGADLTYELSGNPEALDRAIAVTGYDGRVVIGSWYGTKDVDLDLGGRFHRSRIDLRSSQVSTIDPALRGRWTSSRRYAVAWEQLRDLDVDALLTDRVPIAEADRAYEAITSGSDRPIGVVLTY